MKVALISPHYTPLIRGNAVTVQRIEQELRSAGCHVAIHALDTLEPERSLSEIGLFRPELIHAFHGYLGGRVARRAAERLNIPYLVTLTGTDVYEALTDARRGETCAALAGAAGLAVFHDSVRQRLAEQSPALAEKTVVVPQGVAMPPADGSRVDLPFPAGAFTFFLPAGLRRVKNVLSPLVPLARLHRSHPQLRFLLAGPVLDADYAAEVQERLEDCPFASYMGTIDHEAIGSLYRSCDVVLNTSLFEGGMANTMLEALAFGKPVLASAAEGNRSLIENEVTGLIYRDSDDFYRQAQRLIDDAALRNRLGAKGHRKVRENFSPQKEGAAYLDLYQQIRYGRQV